MRKIELGAGLAAGILSVIGMLVLLFGPLVSYCADRGSTLRQCTSIRYTSLASAGLTASGWAFTVGMFVAVLAAAAGAVGESRFGIRNGAILLWAGGALVLFGCALTAGNIGLFYLPSVLALGLATYASVLRRMNERYDAQATAGDSSTAAS
ncbi:MAG TPA: hypothetical protein VKQ30_22165 [Ktedonobacterales bacterium]|nr:hypothetical protein [Ktedonobacterales bacterium]